MATRYWIGVASRDHVRKGVEQGFAQLGHGRKSALGSLKSGDWIVYYSPRTCMEGGDAVQAFTAIGQIRSDAACQADLPGSFKPYRVDVAYERSAKDAPIRPILDSLELTGRLGGKWGMAFRGAKREISCSDFARIAEAMSVTPR